LLEASAASRANTADRDAEGLCDVCIRQARLGDDQSEESLASLRQLGVGSCDRRALLMSEQRRLGARIAPAVGLAAGSDVVVWSFPPAQPEDTKALVPGRGRQPPRELLWVT
jgi:hypothetical protein